jgi:hypothetical protein
MHAFDWAPVICIYGVRETDSLYPALAGRFSHVIALPGIVVTAGANCAASPRYGAGNERA